MIPGISLFLFVNSAWRSNANLHKDVCDLLGGVVYQFVTTKIDERRYPPLGEMVDVGGYKLHLN
jgi:hypothetical protein